MINGLTKEEFLLLRERMINNDATEVDRRRFSRSIERIIMSVANKIYVKDRAVTIDDIKQDLFIISLRMLKAWNPQHEKGMTFSSYLFQYLELQYYNSYRNQSRHVMSTVSLDGGDEDDISLYDTIADKKYDTEKAAISNIELENWQAVMSTVLTDKEQFVFIGNYQGRTVDDMAQELEVPNAKVRSLFSLAVRKLHYNNSAAEKLSKFIPNQNVNLEIHK
jgi:RNA polymerase sigma factor (sigma-70 family)